MILTRILRYRSVHDNVHRKYAYYPNELFIAELKQKLKSRNYSPPQIRCHLLSTNKNDRFCNKMATVALTDTSIQIDWSLQTKEILSTGKSNQTRSQKLPRKQQGKLMFCASKRWFLREFMCI